MARFTAELQGRLRPTDKLQGPTVWLRWRLGANVPEDAIYPFNLGDDCAVAAVRAAAQWYRPIRDH